MAERTEHEPLGDWDPAPVLRLSMSISDPTFAWGGNVDVTTWFRSKSRSALKWQTKKLKCFHPENNVLASQKQCWAPYRRIRPQADSSSESSLSYQQNSRSLVSLGQRPLPHTESYTFREEKWLAVSFTGSPFHLFMNLSHVGLWCLRNTTKYLDTSITVNPHTNLCCHFGWEVTSSGRPNVWPEFSQCQGRELGLSIRITSKRAGCSARPGSSPLTLSTARKPCQALFLAQAKGLPPFHRALHHCRNNLEFSAVFFFGYVTNFLQAFSRVICSFSQMPRSPRATETSSCLIWCPRLLQAFSWLEDQGPGLGGGQGVRTLDGEGGKEPHVLGVGHHWTSSQYGEWGPSPNTLCHPPVW